MIARPPRNPAGSDPLLVGACATVQAIPRGAADPDRAHPTPDVHAPPDRRLPGPGTDRADGVARGAGRVFRGCASPAGGSFRAGHRPVRGTSGHGRRCGADVRVRRHLCAAGRQHHRPGCRQCRPGDRSPVHGGLPAGGGGEHRRPRQIRHRLRSLHFRRVPRPGHRPRTHRGGRRCERHPEHHRDLPRRNRARCPAGRLHSAAADAGPGP